MGFPIQRWDEFVISHLILMLLLVGYSLLLVRIRSFLLRCWKLLVLSTTGLSGLDLIIDKPDPWRWINQYVTEGWYCVRYYLHLDLALIVLRPDTAVFHRNQLRKWARRSAKQPWGLKCLRNCSLSLGNLEWQLSAVMFWTLCLCWTANTCWSLLPIMTSSVVQESS